MAALITAILLEAMFQIWKRPEITRIGFLAWVESLPDLEENQRRPPNEVGPNSRLSSLLH